MLVCFIWVTKRKKSSYEATYIIPLLALYKYVNMPLNMYTVKRTFRDSSNLVICFKTLLLENIKRKSVEVTVMSLC